MMQGRSGAKDVSILFFPEPFLPPLPSLHRFRLFNTLFVRAAIRNVVSLSMARGLAEHLVGWLGERAMTDTKRLDGTDGAE